MYAIMRVEKRKRSAVYGLQVEANRTVSDRGKDFAASDIDWDRTKENYHFPYRDCTNWNNRISMELRAAGIKARKDSVVLIDGLYTASPEWFKGKSKQEIKDFFADCLAFHEKHYGKCINAVVHMDEATPHMHVQSIPLTQDNRLSAKTIMGSKSDYYKRQNDFYESVARDRGFDRCKQSDPKKKRKHLSVQDFKIQQAQKELEALTVECEALKKELLKCKTELSDIKKKELEQGLEVFTTKMIAYLSSDNITISDGKSTTQFKDFFLQNWNAYKEKHFPDLEAPDIERT